MYCLPNSLATTIEVPLPQKKSATTSPSFENPFIILSNNFLGFWVSYPTLSLADWVNEFISSQTSVILAPSLNGV